MQLLYSKIKSRPTLRIQKLNDHFNRQVPKTRWKRKSNIDLFSYFSFTRAILPISLNIAIHLFPKVKR